jgi:hypothetical protein
MVIYQWNICFCNYYLMLRTCCEFYFLGGRWGQRGHWGHWGRFCLKSGIDDSGDNTEKNLSFKKAIVFC